MLIVAARRNELSVRFESKDCGFKTQIIIYKIYTCKFNTPPAIITIIYKHATKNLHNEFYRHIDSNCHFWESSSAAESALVSSSVGISSSFGTIKHSLWIGRRISRPLISTVTFRTMPYLSGHTDATLPRFHCDLGVDSLTTKHRV